jgi:hypothetical protein
MKKHDEKIAAITICMMEEEIDGNTAAQARATMIAGAFIADEINRLASTVAGEYMAKAIHRLASAIETLEIPSAGSTDHTGRR